MPTDSVLAHYTTQLVSGGWRADGKPGIAENVAAQRFSFREGQDDWMAALVIVAVGDRRAISLEFTRAR